MADGASNAVHTSLGGLASSAAKYGLLLMLPKWTLIWAAIASSLVAGYSAFEAGPPLLGCAIKGNISYDTGERIYHVPGQQYYSKTRISLRRGERWFCSEEAAREAGWRKSKL